VSAALPAAAVANESSPRAACTAAIEFSGHPYVLMALQSIALALHAEVRELDRLVEVRQVVLLRPPSDLIGVPIGSPSLFGLDPVLGATPGTRA
jgi:hypothetical protein